MPVRAQPKSNRRERRRQHAAARKGSVKAPPSLTAHKRTLLICFALAGITFALYSRALTLPFIEHYDDENYVTANLHVQAGLSWTTVKWAITSTELSNWHPLTWLSHALDCELFGLNPTGHHFTNIFLHALNVLLLFLLLLRATGYEGRSFLLAALFAVHPFNVESVAWIAERKNVLSMFFFLLTLAAYGWYVLKPNLKRYAAVMALFALALAAKAMVVTLPCVLLLLDFWPLKRIKSQAAASQPDVGGSSAALAVPQAPFSRLIAEKLPLLVLSAANSAVTIYAQRSYGAMRLVLPLGVRLENAIYAYAMYIWKAFWPARLTVFYPHPQATLAAWQVGLAALFLLGISALVWQQRSRQYLVTGWLWYLGTLVPVIGLIQVGEQAMADRYAYLPLIGVFLMVVWATADIADARQITFRTRANIAAIVLIVLAAFSWQQIRYWRSAYDLWSHAVEITKDNFTAESNLGVTLMSSDRASEAIPHLQNAARIKPKDPLVHVNLAGALELSGQPREAIPEYQSAIALGPNPEMLAVAYENLGHSYEQIGNYALARTCYQEALVLSPNKDRINGVLNNLDLSEAIRKVAESPSTGGFLQLARLLQQRGQNEQARAAYQRALELDPKSKDAKTALQTLGSQ
jgi:protein O-mannosyl-transferase